MKFDKIALEKISQDHEVDIESDSDAPLTDEERLNIRENVLTTVENYFRYMGASNKDETFEALSESREALYQIYTAARRTRSAISLATKPENRELAEVLNNFISHIAVQAESVFGEMN